MGAASDSLADQPIGKDAQGKSVHCFSWARLVGNVALSLALCSCIGLMLYENTSIALNVHFSTRRKEDAAVRSPILLLTSRRCNRIDLPAQLSNSTQGPYNPAAIKSPQTGEWLLFLRIEEIWFVISNYTRDGTYLEGRMRSHPLLARMGNDTIPASQHRGPVTMLDLDESYMRKAQSEGSDLYKVSDWRPFVWRDEIFLGHWMAYLPGQERMALSVLNLREGKVELVHRFSALSEELEEIVARPEAPASVRPLRKLLPLGKAPFETPVFRREKNWGFMEEDDTLLITYALLPCTIVLEYIPEEPDNLRFRSKHCYATDAPAILQASGLDILSVNTHMSGNPVPYDILNGKSHQEYIALLHVKRPEYINWAVRINKYTKQITHVSAGPILKNNEFRNEGFMQTALVVSSFHVLPKSDQARGPEDTMLRVYYGEGDRYGCWLDIDMRNIVWHRLVGSSRPAKSRALPVQLASN